jgi:hypothetical protein
VTGRSLRIRNDSGDELDVHLASFVTSWSNLEKRCTLANGSSRELSCDIFSQCPLPPAFASLKVTSAFSDLWAARLVRVGGRVVCAGYPRLGLTFISW